MTDITKARMLTLIAAAKEDKLVAMETSEGVIWGILDRSEGFMPLAAVWPDNSVKLPDKGQIN